MITDSNQDLIAQNRFAEYINSAYLVINSPFSSILQLFKDKEVNVINYPYKGLNRIIEVHLDAATLSCLFNEKGICNTSFLFLDNLDDLSDYIDYCDKTYTYNSQLNGWIVENCCCLRINPYKDDCFFSLLLLIQD